MTSKSDNQIIVIYDKHCPFCRNYSQLVRLKSTVKSIVLVEARKESAYRDEADRLGYDLDQGMLIKFSGQFYYGADAIHILACLSDRNDWFNRFNYWIFRSANRSRLLYPTMRFFRNFWLRLVGVGKINNLKATDYQTTDRD